MKHFVTSVLARSAIRGESDEAGQGLAEYGLILAFIALVCIAGLTGLGQAISDTAGFVALPQTL